jgi:hypothetical protein
MYATELDCTCTAKVLTVRTFRNNSQHYAYQCITCGQTEKSIKKEDAEKLVATGEKLEPYDESAADRYRNMLRTVNDLTRMDQKARRLQEYNLYLQSEEWALRRKKVIERCGNICEGCRRKQVEHIHHLTYTHTGRELLFQLVGLCESCHKAAHDDGAANV